MMIMTLFNSELNSSNQNLYLKIVAEVKAILNKQLFIHYFLFLMANKKIGYIFAIHNHLMFIRSGA